MTRPLKTLDRVLSKRGVGSRTDARRWISEGRVCVNGTPARNPDLWVDLERDRIQFDGKSLVAARKTCILLYKPKGYVTTYRDPAGRPTVYDLITDAGLWLSPVGRLDLDTSGLLLMTNDTDFAECVTNPEYHVSKTYLVKTANLLSEEQIEQLRHGVQLRDGPTRPAVAKRLRDGKRTSFLEMTITEGRNRQVRRMVEAIGSRVLKLVRVAIGPLQIGDLEIGKWRRLTYGEMQSIARANLPRKRMDLPSKLTK